MSFLSKLYHSMSGRTVAGMLGLLLLLAPLASCGGGGTQPQLFTTLNLGIPAEAMNSPVTGQLPDFYRTMGSV